MSRVALRLAVGVVAPVTLAACATVTSTELDRPEFEVTASVASGSEVALPARPPVTGLSSGAVLERSDDRQQAQDPDDRAAALRARFGSALLVRPDGKVTKQYFFSKEATGVMLGLLTEPGKPPPEAHKRFSVGGPLKSASMLGRMLGDHQIEVLYLESFETPEGVPIRSPVLTTEHVPSPDNSPNNLALITAEPAGLAAFEGALNLFFANIPQIEIEVKVVEYTTTDSLSVGIDQVDPATPSVGNLSSGKLVENLISQFPLRTPLLGPGGTGSQGIVMLGGIQDALQLNAQLELLEARGVADVLSSPKLVVRNGGTASVATRTDLPYPEAKITSSGQNVEANIVFKPVGITLNIRPVLAGTQTVILQIFANVSAVTDFAATEPVSTPVISSREVLTTVHVTDGKTTVIGGLVTHGTIRTETKFPVLGDIPILGYLFRSTSETTQQTTLHFHITPRVVQGPRGFADGGSGG